jgi:lysophospholipase L1-like esterase
MKHHPEARIILTEHCGYSNMKIYKNQRDAVNSANINLREAYSELLVRYANNLYYITREELGLNVTTDFADYIHPNDKGMYRYAEKYLEVLDNVIAKMKPKVIQK